MTSIPSATAGTPLAESDTAIIARQGRSLVLVLMAGAGDRSVRSR